MGLNEKNSISRSFKYYKLWGAEHNFPLSVILFCPKLFIIFHFCPVVLVRISRGSFAFSHDQSIAVMKKSPLPLQCAGGSEKKKGQHPYGKDALVKLLRWHFGHAEFRGKQLEAIEAVLSGNSE